MRGTQNGRPVPGSDTKEGSGRSKLTRGYSEPHIWSKQFLVCGRRRTCSCNFCNRFLLVGRPRRTVSGTRSRTACPWVSSDGLTEEGAHVLERPNLGSATRAASAVVAEVSPGEMLSFLGRGLLLLRRRETSRRGERQPPPPRDGTAVRHRPAQRKREQRQIAPRTRLRANRMGIPHAVTRKEEPLRAHFSLPPSR